MVAWRSAVRTEVADGLGQDIVRTEVADGLGQDIGEAGEEVYVVLVVVVLLVSRLSRAMPCMRRKRKCADGSS
jgi:hypothetical protein